MRDAIRGLRHLSGLPGFSAVSQVERVSGQAKAGRISPGLRSYLTVNFAVALFVIAPETPVNVTV